MKQQDGRYAAEASTDMRLANIERKLEWIIDYLKLTSDFDDDGLWRAKVAVAIKSHCGETDPKRIYGEIYRAIKKNYGIDLDAIQTHYRSMVGNSSVTMLHIISMKPNLMRLFEKELQKKGIEI